MKEYSVGFGDRDVEDEKKNLKMSEETYVLSKCNTVILQFGAGFGSRVDTSFRQENLILHNR